MLSLASRSRVLCLAAVCLAGHAAGCLADVPVDTGNNLLVGPGVYVTPTYPGATGSRAFPLPYIDAQYHNLVYSNASDLLGIYGHKTSTTEVGGALQYDFTERLSTDDRRLKFLPEIHDTPRFKLFANKTVGLFTGDVSVATDIAGRGQGTLALANLWLSAPFVHNWFFSAGPGLTWADHEYMNTFFSITQAQAAVSPLTTYSAKAGIVDLHLNGIVTYTISSRWSLGATAYAARLHGDAGHSSVTQRRSQTTALAYLAYRFW